jgi:histidinol-phosphate/aromatic aminotransferase/cobyric acid decarboxylase-like protein
MANPAATPSHIDLDQNENPLGASEQAVRLIQLHAASVHEYPDGVYAAASEAVAVHYGLRPDEVFITEGVDEAIDFALLHTGRGSTFTPGYWPYWERADALGAPMRRLTLNAEWQPDEAMLEDIDGTLFIAQRIVD